MIQVTKLGCTVALLFLLSVEGVSAPFIQLDSISLAKVRLMIHDETASERTLVAYQNLLEEADQLLTIANPTVMDKSIDPPTGNKHDYLSISRYWWPNPKVPDGLPWIRKDGETNPDTQTDTVDRNRLGRMTQGVRNLSLAYFFSGDERYAQKATSMIHTWFLDDDTRMNPHMKFAQSVPGNPRDMPYGILDSRSVVMFVPDAINLISQSQHWTPNHQLKMTQWLTEYLAWLTESNLGKKGWELDNNHGSWYKFQVASLALYLGNHQLVKKTVELAQESLSQQLNELGGQIHEIERTRSFFYSCFNLEALTNIATIGDQIGMDMWHFESDEKKSLSLALNYLTPAIRGEDWPHPSKNGINLSYVVPVLSRMCAHSESTEWDTLLTRTISMLVEKEKITDLENNTLMELRLVSGIN